jgi:NAD(P)-dependent dehydrogenase (short-subunit alcohol dehydrogenase family)
MAKRIEGKVAIVTGGGTGIGQGIALMLAQEGARVVVGGRREGPLVQTVQRIRHAGGEATYRCTDVTVEADCVALVEQAVGAYGGLDVLVSNAGAYPRRLLADLGAASSSSVQYTATSGPRMSWPMQQPKVGYGR